MKDLMTEPVGKDKGARRSTSATSGRQRRDLRADEVRDEPKAFRSNYGQVKSNPGKLWEKVEGAEGARSTTGRRADYIAEPPFFDGFAMTPAGAVPA
jgi:aconitate hydratase